MVVKYTDIDYEVFTDAARHVSKGGSPYDRATYRYTPLLAWIIVPNVTLHKAFGKLLFVFCDIVAGYLIHLILKARGIPEFTAVKYSWFWLLNPMIITVSTRGNAESILAVLVLSSIYFMLKRRFTLSAVMLALSVHFKIYPIIYALPLFLNVGLLVKRQERTSEIGKHEGMLWAIFSNINHPNQFLYAFIASSIFLGINATMYYIYGLEFLEHTYFYHVTRKDVKHNFSVYFYLLYLTMDTSFSWVISLLAFLPQLVLVLVFAVKYYKDLPFCCFVQTFAFVIFNKVCTSQYFLWYLSLLPLILPQVQIDLTKGFKMLFAWFASQ
ncbi:GPI mannosyltransferase 1-like isoform X2 [Dendronephthya gigantea]|nr:GPI mannosyltransferase 1-like isoform X2 [Dendronephthya gigantea]